MKIDTQRTESWNMSSFVKVEARHAKCVLANLSSLDN